MNEVKPIRKFVLSEHTNNLYKKEAGSSIALARDVANKLNELIEAFNTLAKEKWEKIHEQDGTIRKAIVYMKDNLINSIETLLQSLKDNGTFNDIVSDVVLNEYNNIKKRLENVVSVKEFGCLGNGVNDTLPFKEALNYCIANDKILYLPTGNYAIKEDINITADNVTIEGDNAVLLMNGNNIIVGNSDKITYNFNLSGIKIKNGSLGIHRVNGFNIEKCYFLSNEYGLKGSHSYVGHINKCEFNGCTYGLIFDKDLIGVNDTPDHNAIIIDNCKFYNNVNPFIIKGGFMGEFTNNKVEGNNNGIVIEGMSDYSIKSNYFEYNKGTIITLNTYSFNNMLNNSFVIGYNRIFGDSTKSITGLKITGTIMGLILEPNSWGGLGTLINKDGAIFSGCYFMKQVNNSGLTFPNLNSKYSSIDNTLVLNATSDVPSIVPGRIYLKDNHLMIQTRLGDYDLEYKAGYIPTLANTPNDTSDGLIYIKNGSLKIKINGVEKTINLID